MLCGDNMVRYVEDHFEIITEIDREKILKLIELCGRTCYKSESKITNESCKAFAGMIKKRNHLSVIEHVSISVRIVGNRGLTHELVRHRIASYSQESTRYCNYGDEINVIDQRNMFLRHWDPDMNNKQGGWKYASEHEEAEFDKESYKTWLIAMEDAEASYSELIKKGCPPEIARGVLPLDVKTEIVITANLREWLHIFEMRCSPNAHPNIRKIMCGIRAVFAEKLPEIFA